MADLRLDISAEDKASDALRKVATSLDGLSDGQKKQTEATEKQSNSFLKQMVIWDGLKEGASKLVEITRESIRLYAEQEKADKQLSLSAGNLTAAFLEQASAIEKATGMDAIATEKMQGMLLTFGVAPQEIKKTVDALLDYSARTGVDGVSATEMLLKSVESGRSGFKGLNLTMSDTSTQAERMTGYVDALGSKFGGSLAADSETLAGRSRIAAAAMEDLQKSFGAFALEAVQKTGAVSTLSDAMRGLMMSLGMNDDHNRMKKKAAIVDEIASLQDYVIAYQKADQSGKQGFWARFVDAREAGLSAQSPEDVLRRYQSLLEQAAKMDDSATTQALGGKGSLRTTIDKPAAAIHEKAKEVRDATAEEDAADESLRQHNIAARAEAEKKAAEDLFKIKIDSDMREFHQRQEQMKKIEEWDKAQLALDKENAKKLEEQQRKMGEQMGNALLGGLTSALNQASTGGEVDVASILSGILGTAVTIALASNPATEAFAGAGGGLAAAGGMALSRAFGGSQKRHEGGWIDAPRYHSGAWVGADEQPAILQTGERVLSRSEVRNMGGQSGVESAARGGGGTSVTVNTFDGQTTRDFFERAGGRALLNAVRTGRGAPALLFGGG